ASRAAMRALIAGWFVPSRFAAAVNEPSSETATNASRSRRSRRRSMRSVTVERGRRCSKASLAGTRAASAERTQKRQHAAVELAVQDCETRRHGRRASRRTALAARTLRGTMAVSGPEERTRDATDRSADRLPTWQLGIAPK